MTAFDLGGTAESNKASNENSTVHRDQPMAGPRCSMRCGRNV